MSRLLKHTISASNRNHSCQSSLKRRLEVELRRHVFRASVVKTANDYNAVLMRKYVRTPRRNTDRPSDQNAMSNRLVELANVLGKSNTSKLPGFHTQTRRGALRPRRRATTDNLGDNISNAAKLQQQQTQTHQK